MPTLNETIGAILQDVTKAKEMADNATNNLIYRYLTDETMRYFNIPNFEIKELKVTLKCIVKNIDKENIEIGITQEELKEVSSDNITTIEFSTKTINNTVNPDTLSINQK